MEGSVMICKRIYFLVTVVIVVSSSIAISDELKLERKEGTKYKRVVIKDVFVVEETQNCLRYLVFNKQYQSPEPRLANKTEGGDEQCASYKKSSDNERKAILWKWRKQSYTAKVTLVDGTSDEVYCTSIKYPLSSSASKYEAIQPWQKPALLLRDGSELKFSDVNSISLDPKTASATLRDRNGKTRNVQYVIKRRIHNGDLNGVLIGITDKYTYYRMQIDKIIMIELIK
jgi:hypothetical protein